MRPIKLQFQGINSYIKPAEIVFDKLLDDGIFGIFGNTGSGKTTVLDCILLALYSRTSRTSQAQDFINNSCLTAYVDFTFAMRVDGENKIFRVKHDYKLKPDRRTSVHKAYLSEIKDEVETRVAEGADEVQSRLREIIGLRLEEFEKCIILPQGAFAKFVNMKKGERISMMETLFGLDKYGRRLSDKVKSEYARIECEMRELDGSLKAYGEATDGAVKSLEEQLEKTRLELISQNEKNSEIEDKFKEIEKNYEKRKNLDRQRNKLAELNKSFEEMKLKESLVDRFSDAKLVCDALSAAKETGAKTAETEKELSSVCARISALEADASAHENKRSELSIREKLLSSSEIALARLNEMSEEQKENDKRVAELRTLREKYAKLSEKEKRLEENLSRVGTEAGQADGGELKKIKEKISELLSNVESAAYAGFVGEELEFLLSLSNEASESARALISERCDYLRAKLTEAPADLKSLVSRLTELYERLDEANKKLSALKADELNLNAELKILLEQKSSVYNDGLRLSEQVKKFEEKIKKITGGKLFGRAADELNAAIKAAREFKEQFALEERKIAERSKELTAQKARLTEKINNLKASAEKELEKAKTIADGKFSDEAEARAVLRSVGDPARAKEEVREYNNEVFAVKDRIAELETELDGINADDEVYRAAAKEKADAGQSLKLLNEKYNKLSKEYEILSQNFNKRCIIESKLKEIGRKFKLYDGLLQLLRQNGLVNFVAEEYLKEIAGTAKATLLELSDGKFGLCYDGEFFVEDNVLGGEKRRVDTVSGGELFLVSLSLALSLSRSIYARSRKPIEFFFLDEGFGSLDSELAETVMDSLVKLSASNLSIGVITHVDSLKERINAKICVTGAVGGEGSTLTVTA